MSVRLALALLFLALAPASAQSTAAGLPPAVVPQGLGVNIHFAGAPAQDLEGLKTLGVRWVRVDFLWDRIERTRGVYDFTEYDRLVNALAAQHIHPLFILDYGNDLYQKGSPTRPDARRAFARFAAASARHYLGRDVIWEIWNEPNIDFWQPRPDAPLYAALAVETARAMKQADPFAVVLAPATSGVDTGFEETCFQAGLLSYIDGISFHPYRSEAPETAGADYDKVRALLMRYAPAGKTYALVSSEWGYSTVGVSEERQAQYLVRQWLSNMEQGVALSIWYDWHDDGADPNNPEHHFGTVRSDYSRKPAFLAARTLIRALYEYRFVKRVPLDSDDDYLLIFARGQSLKLAVWTAGSRRTISIPFMGTAHVTQMLSDTQDVAAKDGTLSLPVSQSPVYVDVPAGNEALRLAASWTLTPAHAAYMGEDPTAAIDFTNPLTVPLDVSFTADGGSLSAKVAIQTAGPRRVDPGEEVVFPLPVHAVRIAVRARIELDLVRHKPTVPQPFGAYLELTPGDPIKLSVVPVPGGGYFATIDNPAGEAFSGRLYQEAASESHSVPVALATGAKSAAVWVMGLPGAPSARMFFVLRDGQDTAVSWQPPQRFAPYASQPSDWQTILDGDHKVPSKVAASTVGALPPLPGDAAQIEYSFAQGWTFWRLTDPKAKPLSGKPSGMVLWIWGDNSGDLLRMRFLDSTGQTFQTHAGPCNWQGWRPVVFTLSDSGHWGGANDGVVHYPVTVDSLLVLDSTTPQPASGVLLVCQPTIVYGE